MFVIPAGIYYLGSFHYINGGLRLARLGQKDVKFQFRMKFYPEKVAYVKTQLQSKSEYVAAAVVPYVHGIRINHTRMTFRDTVVPSKINVWYYIDVNFPPIRPIHIRRYQILFKYPRPRQRFSTFFV
jgi:hypothetical protein